MLLCETWCKLTPRQPDEVAAATIIKKADLQTEQSPDICSLERIPQNHKQTELCLRRTICGQPRNLTPPDRRTLEAADVPKMECSIC
ncbi:hypothetical protein ElyMa_005545700 [Elysia marginata]|uniref:Uncharacterized protein n=1 Tax=Elysia marginata TaxID=1093978 RepID=A0AAV4EY57_9GAST|nr:hypothetical protein ElyMa_005545700 [Elysia marginata]